MPPATADGDLTRFLTLADTAEVLSVTVSEATRLVTSGELPAIRVGTAWRIERVVLEAYIDGQYEEARRMSLWQESDYANIPELSEGRILRTAPGSAPDAAGPATPPAPGA